MLYVFGNSIKQQALKESFVIISPWTYGDTPIYVEVKLKAGVDWDKKSALAFLGQPSLRSLIVERKDKSWQKSRIFRTKIQRHL